MSKGNIVLIDFYSSAVNYIKDIYDAGYNPILIEAYYETFFRRATAHHTYSRHLKVMLPKEYKKPTILKAKSDYKDNLKMLKKLNPVLIITGTDDGIELATKASHDLGLVCNNVNDLSKMLNKYNCQEALNKAGIRSIRSKMVSSFEEAVSFFNELGKEKVVIKPVFGQNSYGVYICENESQIEKAIQNNKRSLFASYDAGTGKVLIQEYIDGEEYYFNTVSFNGIHKVTACFKSNKFNAPLKGKVYDSALSLPNDCKEVKAMTEYEFKVLDAIGIKYGPVHAEIMIDKKGPVLIEANCRIMGAKVKSSIYEESFGIHESKIALDSFLKNDKEYINNSNDVLYSNNKRILIKYLYCKETCFVKKFFIEKLFSKLDGFRYYDVPRKKGIYFESVDLASTMGSIYFAHKNKEVLDKYCDDIRDLEHNRINELYKVNDSIFKKIILKMIDK